MDTMNKDNALEKIRASAKRSLEIRQAVTLYPGMEIGAAWKKWKEARGEKSEMLFSNEITKLKTAQQDIVMQLSKRPCTRDGCEGTQHLEGICPSCIEGKSGYKTKWTCDTCMHRNLSKEGLNEWMLKLSSV